MDKMGGVTTPSMAPAAPRVAPTPVAKIAPPVNRAPAPMNTQVRSVQEALAKNKAVQKTYGVPGAK